MTAPSWAAGIVDDPMAERVTSPISRHWVPTSKLSRGGPLKGLGRLGPATPPTAPSSASSFMPSMAGREPELEELGVGGRMCFFGGHNHMIGSPSLAPAATRPDVVQTTSAGHVPEKFEAHLQKVNT